MNVFGVTQNRNSSANPQESSVDQVATCRYLSILSILVGAFDSPSGFENHSAKEATTKSFKYSGFFLQTSV